MSRRILILALAPALLAGCAKGDNEPGPGGVTVGEARALDEAAAMLDARRSPLDGGAPAPSATPAPAPATTEAKRAN